MCFAIEMLQKDHTMKPDATELFHEHDKLLFAKGPK